MIFKASARGGATQLAKHLLSHDNEHCEVADIRGFASSDLMGALRESYAISKATKCRAHLFSISLNPHPDRPASQELFDDALNRIEEKLGLTNQPRVIVYHEKLGRKHMHAVFSRIDPESMRAVQLSHFKLKLRDISREIHLDFAMPLPKGLLNSSERDDERNFDLATYHAAKREGVKGQDLKETIRECFSYADSRAAFESILGSRGLRLARGDRRSHVVVTTTGQILSVARYAGRRTAEVRAKLGAADALPSVEDAKKAMALDMARAFKRHTDEAKVQKKHDLAALDERRRAMTDQHRAERSRCDAAMETRWIEETKVRSQRLNKGLRALLQIASGQYARIIRQNEFEALACLKRDQAHRHDMVVRQLKERRALQIEIDAARNRHAEQLREIRRDAAHYSSIHRDEGLSRQFREQSTAQTRIRTNEERLQQLKKRGSQRGKGYDLER